MAPPRPRIKEEPVDDPSPYLNPRPNPQMAFRSQALGNVPVGGPSGAFGGPFNTVGGPFYNQQRAFVRDPNQSMNPGLAFRPKEGASPYLISRPNPPLAVKMDDLDYISLGGEFDSDIFSPEANKRLGPRGGRNAGIKREYETDGSGSDNEDQELGGVRIKMQSESESDDDVTDDEHPGYISAAANKRIKVKNEQDWGPINLNDLSTSGDGNVKPRMTQAERTANQAAGGNARQAAIDQAFKKLKLKTLTPKQARREAKRARLSYEFIAHGRAGDLDYGPLPYYATGHKSAKKDMLRRLGMKAGRLIREEIQRNFDQTRGPYELSPHIASQQAYKSLHNTAWQKTEHLQLLVAEVDRSVRQGSHVPVGNLDNLNLSLWSQDYMSLVQTPVNVELRIRGLPGYGMEAPGICSYSADLVFSPLFGVLDRIVGLPQMTLPAPNTCVPTKPVKVLAYKVDPTADATLDWMKLSLARHDAHEGHLQYFDVDVTFLGNGRLKLRIPSHACYRPVKFPVEASDWWPTHLDFFAEPVPSGPRSGSKDAFQ